MWAARRGSREFQVARQSIEVADEGRRVARADFGPRIVADGALVDFQQSAPRGHADLALGLRLRSASRGGASGH